MERCGSARSPSCARTSKATRKARRRRLTLLVCPPNPAVLQSSFRSFARRKAQRDAVHAVACSRRFRAIGKDVAEMRVARCATDLGPAHQPRALLEFSHRSVDHRRPEAGPAGAGIELGARREQRSAAANAFEETRALLAVERA